MKIKSFALAGLVAAATLTAFLPTVASAAPPGYRHAHKVCHMERHHHRVCRWVR